MAALANCLLRGTWADLLSHSPSQSEPTPTERPLTGEPDAGKPPVRFDERDVETEQGWAREAPADERAGNR